MARKKKASAASDKIDMTVDHRVLEDARATRRYFAKFERIIGHLKEVADLSEDEGEISAAESKILRGYLDGLGHTFAALSYKFLMTQQTGSARGAISAAKLSIDKADSGFPIFQELLQMASDALQAKSNLATLPDPESLKREMVNHILTHQSAPTDLQFALSQRLYYEHLSDANLFLSQNQPRGMWTGSSKTARRRSYLLNWAVYDSRSNLPVIYLMDVEDTGRTALPKDEKRWPRVKSHLMAQSVSALTLLTIAQGFDTDFDDLHPKTLRRFHLGPMYSHKFTEQHGPLRDVLADASGEPGLDWAVTWMVETLESTKKTHEKTGIFKTSERSVYNIDMENPAAVEIGASDVRRALILPHRAFQVLKERNPRSLSHVRKYVVGENSQIINYR